MSHPFPREARLLKRSEFQRVYREGKSQHHSLMVLHFAPSIQGPEASTRFGFTVSKRVDKRAVHRNRVRRVLWESVRLSRERFAPGWDVVINARVVDSAKLVTPAVQTALISLAEQAGLTLAANGKP